MKIGIGATSSCSLDGGGRLNRNNGYVLFAVGSVYDVVLLSVWVVLNSCVSKLWRRSIHVNCLSISKNM